jgi:hypothetical protein
MKKKLTKVKRRNIYITKYGAEFNVYMIKMKKIKENIIIRNEK